MLQRSNLYCASQPELLLGALGWQAELADLCLEVLERLDHVLLLVVEGLCHPREGLAGDLSFSRMSPFYVSRAR